MSKESNQNLEENKSYDTFQASDFDLNASIFEKQTTNEQKHNHGPKCGHIAIHHATKSGESHVAFVNDDLSTDCMKVSAIDEGCCNMLGEKVNSACSLKAITEDTIELGSPLNCPDTKMVGSREQMSLYVDECCGKLGIQNSEGSTVILRSTSGRLPSKCPLTEDTCEEELCGQKFASQRLDKEANILPSVCTGLWGSLFQIPSSNTKESFFSDREEKKKSSFILTAVTIEDMCCSMEAKMARTCLEHLPGVLSISVNVPLRRISLKHNPDLLTPSSIIKILKEQGLEATLFSTQFNRMDNQSISTGDRAGIAGKEDEPVTQKSAKLDYRVGFALFFLIMSMFQYFDGFENLKYLALVSVCLCLPPILVKSASRLRRFNLDITTLMSLASIGALVLGDYSEGAAVITLYSFSGWLEAIATVRIRNAIEDIIKLKPKQARRVEQDKVVIVSPEDLAVNDIVEVRSGDIIPVDGKVVKGETSIDESALTGEPRPIIKTQDSQVFAGTLNIGSGLLNIKVTNTSSDSVVSKMLQLVEEATANQSAVEQYVEKVAAIYTPLIFFVAIFLSTVPWLWGSTTGMLYFKYALVLLVVGCPCALVISTPITYISGLAQAAKKGILIKGGTHLETLAKIDLMCFDKTGTLTKGKFELLDYVVNTKRVTIDSHSCEEKPKSFPLSLISKEEDIFEMVKLVEAGSNHPIALSLSNALTEKIKAKSKEAILNEKVEIEDISLRKSSLKLDCVEAIKGKGVSAKVYRVYTTKQFEIELIKRAKEIEKTVSCEDKCCVKPGRVNIAEEVFSWNDKSSETLTNRKTDIVISYKLKIVDEDVTGEDITTAANMFKKGFPTSQTSLTQVSKQVAILTTINYLSLEDITKKFMALGLDIVLLKVKVELTVFIGSRTLSDDLEWNTLNDCCDIMREEDDHLFQQVVKQEEMGRSVCIFGTRSKAYAAFFVGDQIREDSRQLITQLKKQNIDVAVLTGDNKHSAQLVCESIGVDNYHAGLLPEDKQHFITTFKTEFEEEPVTSDETLPLISKRVKRKRTVGMIGDGINDALSLAVADISISLGQTGTSLAVETADVTLIEDNLMKLVEAIDLGKLSLSKIKQNIIFSVLLKIVVIAITFGVPYPSLWLAIVSDVGAMLLVTLNSISIIALNRQVK